MGSIISLIFLILELLWSCSAEENISRRVKKKFNFSANFFWHYNNIVIGPQRNKTRLKHVRHWSNQSVSGAKPPQPIPISISVLLWSLTVAQVCTGLHQAGYLVVIWCDVLLSVRVSRHHKHQTRKIFPTVQQVSTSRKPEISLV